MLLNETVSVTLSGTSTTGLAVSLSPAFSLKNATVGDYAHNAYTVNPSTSNAPIDLGLIATGHHLLAISDGPLTLTMTQTTDRSVDMNGVYLIDADFTALKVSNSGTAARQLTILVAGDRAPVGGGPGIFSVPTA